MKVYLALNLFDLSESLILVVVNKLGVWGHLHPSKAPTPQGAPSYSLESVKLDYQHSHVTPN